MRLHIFNYNTKLIKNPQNDATTGITNLFFPCENPGDEEVSLLGDGDGDASFPNKSSSTLRKKNIGKSLELLAFKRLKKKKPRKTG